MKWFDVVNGLFESCGALFIALTVWRTWRDGRVLGVARAYQYFFAAWGFWNLVFYPMAGAWVSFWGGVSTTAANAVWVAQCEYYRRWPRG